MGDRQEEAQGAFGARSCAHAAQQTDRFCRFAKCSAQDLVVPCQEGSSLSGVKISQKDVVAG